MTKINLNEVKLEKKNKNKKIVKKCLGLLISSFIVAISMFPLFWMFLSVFKTKREVNAGMFWPSSFRLEGLHGLTETIFFNSLVITFIGAIISVTFCIIINLSAAYAFARLKFHGKKVLWVLVLLPMFVPGITILIPLYLVVMRMNLLNTLAVLIIPGVAQAIHIFFMRQFFLNVPMSLEEAARIDGAGRFRTFIDIFIPLSLGPTVIVGILAFLGYWNAYLWPVLTIDDDSLKQIMQVVQSFKPSRDPNWPLIMSASTIATLIPLGIYLLFHKEIVESLKISGIK